MTEHNFTLKHQSGEDISAVTFYAGDREELAQALKSASSILAMQIWPIDYVAELERELGKTMVLGR